MSAIIAATARAYGQARAPTQPRGKDLALCYWLWRTIGGRVMVDVTPKLGHRGGAMYLGDPSAMFTAAVE
jgi:hypothetical protein